MVNVLMCRTLGREEIEGVLIDSHQWDGQLQELKRVVNLTCDLLDPYKSDNISKEDFLDGLVQYKQVSRSPCRHPVHKLASLLSMLV